MADDPYNEDMHNNFVATGAVFMLLHMADNPNLTSVAIPEHGPGNQIDIELDFLVSPYRLTIERVTAEPEPDPSPASDQSPSRSHPDELAMREPQQ